MPRMNLAHAACLVGLVIGCLPSVPCSLVLQPRPHSDSLTCRWSRSRSPMHRQDARDRAADGALDALRCRDFRLRLKRSSNCSLRKSVELACPQLSAVLCQADLGAMCLASWRILLERPGSSR